MKKILISDPTLRDGSHAIKHQLTAAQISQYATLADNAGIPIIEVGHGNGLGASSLQVGQSLLADREMLETARNSIKKNKLGIHVIPGFATIKKDLKYALEIGVDVVRVAAHCTEADITARHIGFVREKGKEAFGVLMMSHMASKEILIEEALKMESYGAECVILMDSAGAYMPSDVRDKIGALVKNVSVPVGFHGHNNLGLAIANSIAAIEAGAWMIDGTARGFGAGAGNTQLEVLLGVLTKMNIVTGVDFYKYLDAADLAEAEIIPKIPTISSLSVVSGMAGVFSAFSTPVARVAKQFNVDARDIFFELGKRKIIAGQDDMIIEVALELDKINKERNK
jgi:4-hydroxy 2-oxovalerate aldolase